MRVLLVGCGKIVRKHVDAIRAVKPLEIAGVCDRDRTRAEALAGTLGVSAYTDLNDAIPKSGANIVSILTPSGTHAKLGIQAAKAGRHVIVEKPMALRLSDADELIHTCEQNKVGLFVVKQNRYNRAVQVTRDALVVGRFGKLVLATVRLRWCRKQNYYEADAWRGTWALDGGVLANQASHHIDLLQWLAGPVASVFTTAATRLANIEVEDTALAVLRFENGALGVIEATTACRPGDLEGSVSILGEKGSAIIGGFAANTIAHWAFEETRAEDAEILKTLQTTTADPSAGFGGHRAFYRDVMDSFSAKRDPLVDGREGRKSLELIHAMYESAETGREIFLKNPRGPCRLDG